MTQFTPGMIIEILLILLLVLTVSYCMVLNRRLSRLRSSQHDLRDVISELCASTQTAENAIRGLKATTEDADVRLTDKLHKAQLLTRELEVLTGGAAGMQTAKTPPPPAVTPNVPAAPVAAPTPETHRLSHPGGQARPGMPSIAAARAANEVFAAPDLNDWRHRTMSRLTKAS